MAEAKAAPPPEKQEKLEDGLLKKKKRGDDELDITPMIDIVFLLLIFFLVASKMDESAPVTLPEARHGTEVTSNDALVILVAKGTGDDAIVKTFDGRELKGDESAQETAIGEYIEAGLAGTAPFDTPKKHIVVRGEKGVLHGEISRVTKAIGKVVGEDVPVLYIAVLDSQ